MKQTYSSFGSKAHMLETLKLAYQQVLDSCVDRTRIHNGQEIDKSRHRLTDKQGFELGQRLAKYWLDKSLTERPKIGDMILVPENAASDIEQAFEARVTSYSSCSDSCVEVKPKGKSMYWIVDWTVCQAVDCKGTGKYLAKK